MADPKKKNSADQAKKPPIDPNKKPDHKKILAFVAACDDPASWARWSATPTQGVTEVADAAFRKPGTRSRRAAWNRRARFLADRAAFGHPE